MFTSQDQTAEQNCGMNTANTSFKTVAKFRYLVTTITNKNYIHKEIKSRSNLGAACLPV